MLIVRRSSMEGNMIFVSRNKFLVAVISIARSQAETEVMLDCLVRCQISNYSDRRFYQAIALKHCRLGKA